MIQCKCDFPELESIILQSDNTRCYSTPALIVYIDLINSFHPTGLRVSKFIHTAEQGGKSEIDAHFSKGTSQCIKFMKTYQRNRIRAIASAKGLAFALAWGGGIRNSCVQLLELDRNRLDFLQKETQTVARQLSTFFSRAGEVRFNLKDDVVRLSLETISEHVFSFHAFAYSSVGSGVRFAISFRRNTVEIMSNEKDLSTFESEDNAAASLLDLAVQTSFAEDVTTDDPCSSENSVTQDFSFEPIENPVFAAAFSRCW